MINLVGSSIELGPMLQGIVDLATEATDCHACFIYLLEDGLLTIRAASPVYAGAVGVVQMRIDEGLTGWVARHRTPEFIREGAMSDPRMKFVPELEEERFQSMVAVPILARAGDTIGVIVLHTEAPREFTEDTLKLLVHIASLISGAIENAQLYDQQRRRVDALTSLSGLAQEVATAADAAAIGHAVTRGVRRLLGAEICQLYRLDREGAALDLLSSSPDAAGAPEALSATALLLAAFGDRASRPRARSLWPELDVSDLLVTPLISGGERLGLLCAGAPQRRPFTGEETEMARAVAHLAAIAIKRAELIEGLTNANIVKDLFEALGAGDTAFAATKAGEVRCDLSRPYLMLCAEPAAGLEQGSGEWRAAAELLGHDVAELAPRAAVEAGPGPVRAVLALSSRGPEVTEEIVRRCRELGRRRGAAVGLSELHDSAGGAARAFRQALDATMIGRALLGDGGAIGYAEVGAYRYLVHIAAENAPHDRMRAAVDRLIEYDAKRRTSLLDTLERYLAERRSVIESARELFIHPNTLRQRLGRIEELTGLNLDEDDLLSLELAIKLARLHGRPAEAVARQHPG
ncbi:MAG: GAF domain-containing protein [Solirubrobacterales bacterium]|nr:GAF domain-containing protein [Solirubrobacterales bacterium]